MVHYPLNFEVTGKATAATTETWSASAKSHHVLNLTLAIPPEFEGPGGGLSPEDVYALALQNCYVATFKVFAEKSKLAFTALTTAGTLTVDRDDQGHPWMSAFALRVKLDGVTQDDLARRLLDKVSKSCLIINSVRTACSFDFEVNGAAQVEA